MPSPETNKLLNAHCKALSKDETPLSKMDAEEQLKHLDNNWEISNEENSISRCFKFKNYYETMAFVNAAALVAHQQDHHPDMTISYNKCQITYSTHSVGGLSDNDFICAAKTDAMTRV